MILELLKEGNDIERKAKNLRSMAFSYYYFTGDSEMAISILKDTQELYERLGDAQTKEEIENDIEYIQNE